jgi:hypothetical protein
MEKKLNVNLNLLLLSLSSNIILMHFSPKQACLFGGVVVIDFENAFCVEMHQNNIFLFFKNYF